jgi:hypothetical protein
VLTWAELQDDAPELAVAGRSLLYQYGVGLAFLATVSADGGPRVHPICPLLTPSGIYAFIIPSPKQRDLLRDGRYSMHSYPCDDNEDAFYLSGRSRPVHDLHLRAALSEQFVQERIQSNMPAPAEHDVLFEFLSARCLLTTTGPAGTDPSKLVWRAPNTDHPHPRAD